MAVAAVPSRPDLGAHEQACRLDLAGLIHELQAILGSRLVAYIGGVQETRAVREWATGKRNPRSAVPARLRLALQIALMLREQDTPAVVQAWFQGMNPLLEDRAPARVLREGDPVEVGPEILGAARAFSAR